MTKEGEGAEQKRGQLVSKEVFFHPFPCGEPFWTLSLPPHCLTPKIREIESKPSMPELFSTTTQATSNSIQDAFQLKSGLAQMLKGGVIMDVVNVEQARIAEAAGACAVMALERVPADIRAQGTCFYSRLPPSSPIQ